MLDVNQHPFDPCQPLVTFDETLEQLVKHLRATIPATSSPPEIIDEEYERNGGVRCLPDETLPLAELVR